MVCQNPKQISSTISKTSHRWLFVPGCFKNACFLQELYTLDQIRLLSNVVVCGIVRVASQVLAGSILPSGAMDPFIFMKDIKH